MTKKIVGIVTAAVLALGAMGWECTAAPKSQCQDGSVKVTANKGKTSTYHCENGEWVKQ